MAGENPATLLHRETVSLQLKTKLLYMEKISLSEGLMAQMMENEAWVHISKEHPFSLDNSRSMQTELTGKSFPVMGMYIGQSRCLKSSIQDSIGA